MTAARQLVAFPLPDLENAKTVELAEEVVWGPYPAGNCFLFATADDRLHCLAGDGAILGETSLVARPVGRPRPLDHQVLAVALGDGTLLGVDTATQSFGTLGNVGQPLAAGPLFLSNRLYAATPDGTLVSLPVDASARIASAPVPN
jgi:hypothetical protein